MMGRRLRGFALATTMVLAACGGSTPATQGPGGGTAGPGPTSGSGQQSAAPVTNPPAATPGGNQGGLGTTYTGKVCDLLTPAEVQQITGIAGTTGHETPIQNGAGSCYWTNADDEMGVAISLLTGGAAATEAFDYQKAKSESVEVPGIGDGAVFIPTGQTFYFIKNGTVVGIQASRSTGEADAEMRKTQGAEVARLIQARL